MLIPFKGGCANSDHVVFYRTIKKDADGYDALVTLSDGEEVRAFTEHLDRIGTVIPAQPSWFILRWYSDGSWWKTPIVAWVVNPFGIDPITLEGVERDAEWFLSPDGGVSGPYLSDHRSIEDWEKTMLRDSPPNPDTSKPGHEVRVRL